MRLYCGVRITSGRIPISLPVSHTVTIDSFLSAERCFHHVDNHSCVRKTHLDALDSRRPFHSSRSWKNSSDAWITLTVMSSCPAGASESVQPYTPRRPALGPDESEPPANDA